MKIGFVLDDTLDSTDGVQQYVLALGGWFTEAGHEVHYIVGESHRNDIRNLHSLSKNIAVKFNKNKMSTPLPASSKKISRLLNKLQLDILHVQMPYSPLMGGKVLSIGHKLNVPAVATFHILPASSVENFGAKLLAIVQSKSLKRIQGFISVSRPAKDFVDPLIESDSIIVPNPVSIEKYAPPHPIDKNGKLRIIFVGRLVERKGCRELLEAISELYLKDGISNKSVEVTICGDGALRSELESYTNTHHLDSIVRFKGRVSEKDKIEQLRKAHIAVFPSTGGESFGIVLIEAMAAKTDVVIAGDNPGYRWVMQDHEEQLVTPGNTSEFAQILDTYIQSAENRQKASEWQASRVSEFDINKVGKRIEAVYRATIANSNKQQHNS